MLTCRSMLSLGMVVGSVFVYAQDVQRFDGADSLPGGLGAAAAATTDEATATHRVLEAVSWEPAAFTVEVRGFDAARDVPALERGVGPRPGKVVRFASPRPVEGSDNTVVLDWFVAWSGDGQAGDADDVLARPAVVMVHSLHPARLPTRLLARALAERGVHALVIHLPGYGQRFDVQRAGWHPGIVALLRGAQGVADARRAIDAAAVLPGVDPARIGLVGVSMGGAAAATVAGLDGRPAVTALFLAAGDGPRVLREGAHDAALLREEIDGRGLRERVDEALAVIEPTAVASRWAAGTVWMFNGRFDHVMPRACVEALIEAGGLEAPHVITLEANHYMALTALPPLSAWIAERMEGLALPGE